MTGYVFNLMFDKTHEFIVEILVTAHFRYDIYSFVPPLYDRMYIRMLRKFFIS